jgi:hypothetical protein
MRNYYRRKTNINHAIISKLGEKGHLYNPAILIAVIPLALVEEDKSDIYLAQGEENILISS